MGSEIVSVALLVTATSGIFDNPALELAPLSILLDSKFPSFVPSLGSKQRSSDRPRACCRVWRPQVVIGRRGSARRALATAFFLSFTRSLRCAFFSWRVSIVRRRYCLDVCCVNSGTQALG